MVLNAPEQDKDGAFKVDENAQLNDGKLPCCSISMKNTSLDER